MHRSLDLDFKVVLILQNKLMFFAINAIFSPYKVKNV